VKHLILLIFLVAASAFSDVSAEYEKYVDTVIPLSVEIAKQDAFVRELQVFQNRASMAQSQLAKASESLFVAHEFTRKFKVQDDSFCPRLAEGSVDIAEVARQIFVTSQAINAIDLVPIHLGAYKQVSDGLSLACSYDAAFSQYHSEAIGMELYFPKNVELFDGIYVVYANGTDAQGNKKDGFESVPLVGSIYRFFDNVFENDRLGDLRERLKKGIVNSTQYRQFAKDACRNILDASGNAIFAETHKFYLQLEQLVKEFDRKNMERRVAALRGCLTEYETSIVRAFVDRESANVKEKTRQEAAFISNSKLAIGLHDSINLKILEVREAPCVEGLGKLEDVESELALLQLYLGGDPREKRFIEERQKSLVDWKESCERGAE
jgi:hypothetical protein